MKEEIKRLLLDTNIYGELVIDKNIDFIDYFKFKELLGGVSRG